MATDWDTIRRRPVIRLNLGGGANSHPDPRYTDYIAVDAVARTEHSISHDLNQPIPLQDGSVDRILSEHFLEHVSRGTIAHVLRECHRLLRPGGIARIAVPDYDHPRQRYCLTLGRDPNRLNHVTLTTYTLLRELVAASPFGTAEWHQYWQGDQFNHGPIDYSLGYVQRTPENDRRNQCRGLGQHLGRWVRDLGEIARHGPFVKPVHFQTRTYHPLAVTSVVFDLRR